MFVVVYGLGVFYPAPEYDDYCGKELYRMNTEIECLNAGGVWEEIDLVAKDDLEPVPEGRCQPPTGCMDDYDELHEKRSKSIFIIAIPLGLILISLGAFVFQLNSVGLGIMFGGIGTLIYGAGGYWRYSDDLSKFIISLVALVVLIFLAYWFNKRGSRKR